MAPIIKIFYPVRAKTHKQTVELMSGQSSILKGVTFGLHMTLKWTFGPTQEGLKWGEKTASQRGTI
jgi:hypothetical protein